MSFKGNDTIGDTVPYTTIPDLFRNATVYSLPSADLSPNINSNDDDSSSKPLDFARLVPSNRIACHAFDAIAREIKSHGFEPDTGTSDSDAEYTPKEPLWTGYYRFSLNILPEFTRIGWRVGKGRSRHTNDAVDLLLTKPGHRDVCVAGVHARFHFERRSGTLLLVASNLRGSAVVLNGQSYSHDIRVVGRRSNTIEFGDLAYRLEFVIRSPSQEVRYQRDLRGYLETIYGTQPVPSLLATPSAHDRELGDYIFRSTLAKGGSCVVSVANHAKTGAPAAVKELLRMKRNYKRVDQEIEIAKSLNHNRLAELLSVFYERGESEYQASDVPERVYLFFPLACGTFHALFTPQVTLKDRTIFFKQGLEGIAFLHDKGVMHRAIKPANLAVKQFDPPSAMIIDFGSAAQEEFCFDNPGTIPYLAPEIDYGSKHGRTVDIWSYGIVGLELFELRKPATASTIRVDSRAYDNNRANLEAICKNNTSVIENVILRMFQWRPSERISAADALLHSSLEHVNTKAESS